MAIYPANFGLEPLKYILLSTRCTFDPLGRLLGVHIQISEELVDPFRSLLEVFIKVHPYFRELFDSVPVLLQFLLKLLAPGSLICKSIC